ncbi:MAG: sulfotransferase [Acidobacteria bacterium]|nr:sulfotransferase [Acidobacteriota bacterium]
MSDVIRQLHATHSRYKPVFVIGFPRSGTSLMCQLLRRYLKVSFGTESQFIIRYLRRLPRFGDLRNETLELRQLFPDAQFVHVVRDGRDVTLSIRKESFGSKNACETAQLWARDLESIQRFSSHLPAGCFFELKYEQLTEQPAKILGDLAAFLGIEDPDNRLRSYIAAHALDDVRMGNSGKWYQRLSERDVERFEGVAGEMLEHYGYHLAFQGRARPVSRLEQSYWRLRGSTDRWFMRRYWEHETTKGTEIFVPSRLRGSDLSIEVQ